MKEHTRRRFLRLSGATFAGLGGMSVASARTTKDQLIIDTGNVVDRIDELRLENRGFEVRHNLEEIGYVVAEGKTTSLSKTSYDWSLDIEFEIDLPTGSEAIPESKLETESVTDEPRWDEQWDKKAMDVKDAHQVSRGEGTKVAVIDTGVDAAHPDINNVNMNLSKNFTKDRYGAGAPHGGFHGTHVGGIVGADDSNGTGITGVAPETEIVDCRVFPSSESKAGFGDVFGAIYYAGKIGCDAANLSLGTPAPLPDWPSENLKLALNAYADVSKFAADQGTSLIAAAGNEDTNIDTRKTIFPAEAPYFMQVSATGTMGYTPNTGAAQPAHTPACYTNYGKKTTDIAAPGGNGCASTQDNVLSTVAVPEYDENGNYVGASYPLGGYYWIPGTSMAAPQVAGAVALLRSAHPSLNAYRAYDVLKNTARKDLSEFSTPYGISGSYVTEYHGEGFLNVNDAVRADPDEVTKDSSYRGGESGRDPGDGHEGDHGSGRGPGRGGSGRGPSGDRN